MNTEDALAQAAFQLHDMQERALKEHPIEMGQPGALDAIVITTLLARLILVEQKLRELDVVSVPIVVEADGTLPSFNKPGDAAVDLHADPMDSDTGLRTVAVWIEPRSRRKIQVGIAMAIPPGFRGRIESRSGLSLHFGIEAGAGVIDSGYRGEVGVMLYNHTDDPYLVERGDRIAQLCIEKAQKPMFEVTDRLPPSERGTSGWGSSGVKKQDELKEGQAEDKV